VLADVPRGVGKAMSVSWSYSGPVWRGSRRDFLWASGAALWSGYETLQALGSFGSRSASPRCIQIHLVGGPSSHETFDPKPNAPPEVRGPYGVVRTRLPGVYFSELLPLLAARAHRLTVVRGMAHAEPPVHEIGFQLLQTGGLSVHGHQRPHLGVYVCRRWRSARGLPSWVILPDCLGDTGAPLSSGQAPGNWTADAAPFCAGDGPADSTWSKIRRDCPVGIGHLDAQPVGQTADQEETAPCGAPRLQIEETAALRYALDWRREPDRVRERYGHEPFGRRCLIARRLVEAGVPLVTVNMFTGLYNRITWDCHANGAGLNSSLADYAKTLCPTLDRALAALVDDVWDRGLAGDVLVVVSGEIGRTPWVNRRGGRDHWTRCFSAVMFGGPAPAGAVIGRSDRLGAEPLDQSLSPVDLFAVQCRFLDVTPEEGSMP